MDKAEIAGYMDWRGPAAYTEGQMVKIQRIIQEVQRREREAMRNEAHSCGPTCTNAACVAVREAVAAEREACAKVCEKAITSIWEYSPEDVKQTGTNVCKNLAAAIRARTTP